ncbi:MAG: GTP pyrophosphokinase family protein [Eubacteriales bacterium]|nr:GTP pyrophosphokinase family protein [Eubacteriales bacterium]
MDNFNLRDIVNMDDPQVLWKQAEPFMKLMLQYESALLEMETKLKILNEEFSIQYNRNPFESIKSRVKQPLSIMDKLRRKGFPTTLESIEENLFDVAGIRIICSFIDDIYSLADLLIQQDDVKLLMKKDYIANPKPNGYRSLHLIMEIPIFLSTGKKFIKVEVQFRTIAMDFWASLDHKLHYKKDLPNAEEISKELKECAEIITALDERMEIIRNRIEMTGDVE